MADQPAPMSSDDLRAMIMAQAAGGGEEKKEKLPQYLAPGGGYLPDGYKVATGRTRTYTPVRRGRGLPVMSQAEVDELTRSIPGYYVMSPGQQRQAIDSALGSTPNPRTFEIQRTPRYTARSPLDEFMGLSIQERVQLQRDLQTAGMLPEYRAGVFDRSIGSALTEAMGWANAQGTDWRTALTEMVLAQKVEDPKNLPAFAAPTYLPPDYNTLASSVRTMFRQHLRRDPTDSELAGLADELSGWHREAYEAQIDAMRLDHYADQRASGAAGVAVEEQGGGTVQDVDPASRLTEEFEKRYRHAIDMENAEDESLSSINNFFTGIGIGARALGGS